MFPPWTRPLWGVGKDTELERRFMEILFANWPIRKSYGIVTRRLLHIFQCRAVLERRGDECRAHRMRGVAAHKSERGGARAPRDRSRRDSCADVRPGACRCAAAAG